MLTIRELKSLLGAQGLRLSKRLGQHYLVDPSAIRRILELSGITRRDTVVEIGAGLGALTEPLAGRAGFVIAVEVDRAMCRLLAQRLRAHQNVAVICQDILTFPWERASAFLRPSAPPSVLPRMLRVASQRKQNLRGGGGCSGFRSPAESGGLHSQARGVGRLSVVGAIPYQITSPILVSLCEARRSIRQALLIVQEEVARRITSGPGMKTYGRLSILAQYYWQTELVLPISRDAFFPQPQVRSRCLRLTPRGQPPVPVNDEGRFFAVVKAAFAKRRKTLVNCLSSQPELGLGRREAEGLVNAMGLPAAIRGEALSLGDFAKLANSLR